MTKEERDAVQARCVSIDNIIIGIERELRMLRTHLDILTKVCKDEPQTDTEIAKAIVHKMIDDAVIAEDAYPDLRQKMHNAVDEYDPQTERSE